MTTLQPTQNSSENSVIRSLAKETLAKLKAIYPAGYATLKTVDQKNGYKKEFVLALLENDINSMEMIDKGLMKAREDSKLNSFLPAPHRFIDWCKPQPEDFGLMSADDAYIYASKECAKRGMAKRWPDTVVWKAAAETGFFEVSSMEEKEIKPTFCRIYNSICARFLAGEKFEIRKERRLENKPSRTLTKDENIKHLEEMRRDLNI